MKCLFCSLVAAVLVTGPVCAGSFGPPPFSNGSPLVTGVDGSYQASARAQNVTGIFRFQYSGGRQTATNRENSWVFFVNGQVQRGAVTASIGEGKISGVLDSLSVGGATNSNGSIQLPIVLLNANNAASGDFNGKISPNGNITGSGKLSPALAQTNQVIVISGTNFVDITGTTFTNGAGSFTPTIFKFRGVRNTTLASSGASTGISTNSP